MTQFSFLLKPKAGQAGLMAIAVSIIIALVMAGSTLSNMSSMDAQRNLVDRRSLQAYYVAQAGLQEALATRMLPRSNYLNFVTPPNTPGPVTPYYNNSGLVFQNPANQTGLIGAYRYLIVGGDPSRKADGSYYGIPGGPPFAAGGPDVTSGANPIPRLVTFNTNPPASPFIVLSNGITCVRDNNATGADQGVDKFIGSTANITSAKQLTLDGNLAAQCQPGYSIQEVTLVAQVSLQQENGALDKVDSVRIYKDRSRLTLPANAFVPGQGWVTAANATVNFDNAWGSHSSAIGQDPVHPMRMVFFQFGTNKIYQSVDISGGGSITIPNPVPADASMMLYFDGPIDYRSISGVAWNNDATWYYDKNLTGCKSGNSYSCMIRLYENITNPWFPLYTGLRVVPILPYCTKVLLLAPLGGNLNTGGQSYHMDIGGQTQYQMNSFSFAPAANSATLTFTTQ